MISLILTILCSTIITLILKHNSTQKGNQIVLLTSNYFIALLISLGLLLIDSRTDYSMQTFGFGICLAIMFVFAFFVFTKAVEVAGAALSSVSARLSVIVPIVLSIVIYSEIPCDSQFIGFLLAFITILLFYYSIKNISSNNIKHKNHLYLIALLLGIGLNDFCMKIFQFWRPQSEKAFFLFSIFTFSFVYTFAYIRWKHISIDRKTVIRGLALGIPNIFSSYFLLGALDQLPAILVYPITNIGIILLTTFGAIIFWKERLNSLGKLSLISGIIAIILLSLPR